MSCEPFMATSSLTLQCKAYACLRRKVKSPAFRRRGSGRSDGRLAAVAAALTDTER